MERKSDTKTTLAALICVLLMANIAATYANSPSVSEKLVLSDEPVDT